MSSLFSLRKPGISRSDLESLYRSQGPLVLRRARTILGDDATAQEALQEVFAILAKDGSAFRAEADARTYLYRVTTNHCLNLLKRRRLQLRHAEVLEAEPTEEARAEALTLLRQILAQSDEKEARAAIYHFVDQMTYDEIAPLLDVSRRTVGNLVERFRTRARAQAEGVQP